MNVVAGSLVVLAACTGVLGQSLESKDLMHRAVLDQEGKFVMLWTPRDEDIVIEVQVSASTLSEAVARNHRISSKSEENSDNEHHVLHK